MQHILAAAKYEANQCALGRTYMLKLPLVTHDYLRCKEGPGGTWLQRELRQEPGWTGCPYQQVFIGIWGWPALNPALHYSGMPQGFLCVFI